MFPLHSCKRGRARAALGLLGVGACFLVLATACQKNAAPPGSSPSLTPSGQKPSASPLSAPIRTQRPEARMGPVTILNTGQMFSSIPKEGLEYLSETGMSGEGAQAAIAPIDKISQWLFDDKYKCINTMRVSWNGASAVIQHKTLGDKRAVIECHGDCRDIRYSVGAQALLPVIIDHFGLSQPMPVLHLHGPSFGGFTVVLSFKRLNPVGKDPRIAVHMWTKDFGDYGGGCHFEN